MKRLILLFSIILLSFNEDKKYNEELNMYNNSVNKYLTLYKDYNTDNLVMIILDDKNEYYKRQAAVMNLRESDSEVLNILYSVLFNEEDKCMKLPLILGEFRPVCEFIGALGDKITKITLYNLSFKEVLNKCTHYIKLIENKYNYCSSKKIQYDECIKDSEEDKKNTIISSGCFKMLKDKKYSDEELREIVKIVDMDSQRLRQLFVNILLNNPNRIVLPTIIRLLNEDSDWGNRYWAIKAIEKIGDKGAIPHLQKVLNNKNENEKVRKAAEEAIKSLSK